MKYNYSIAISFFVIIYFQCNHFSACFSVSRIGRTTSYKKHQGKSSAGWRKYPCSSLSSIKGEEIQQNIKHPQNLFIEGPSHETKPNYDEIHGPLGPQLDRIFLMVFRSKFAEKVGIDSKLPQDDYMGLMELTNALNARFSNKIEIQNVAQNVLRSLFPSWLPGAFGVMFAKPFPKFSARMNAWATWVVGTWLMGECEVNDCEIDGGNIGENQGVLVKRCRFLEESGCVSVCVNSCKIPTQNFFNGDMKLPLTMTPDYETGECQFSFGLTPTQDGETEALNTPCFARCPSSGGLRQWHNGRENSPPSQCNQML